MSEDHALCGVTLPWLTPSAVLVRRVVEARKNAANGIPPDLPTSTGRTKPLDPLPPSDEKVGHSAFDYMPDTYHDRSKKWWQFWRGLKCW